MLLSQTPLILAEKLKKEGHKIAVLPQISPLIDAQKLYHDLRELDQLQLDYIIAQPSTLTGIGIAINDRLQKASHKIHNS